MRLYYTYAHIVHSKDLSKLKLFACFLFSSIQNILINISEEVLHTFLWKYRQNLKETFEYYEINKWGIIFIFIFFFLAVVI